MTLKTIEGTFIAPKGRYALVVGRFNSFVVESLVSGAVDAWSATAWLKARSPSSAPRVPSRSRW